VTEAEKDLGKLVAAHGIAPAYIQRAIFIAILSFLFFLAMMFAFYIRQSMVYFLLASAFLVLYLVTMFSWVMQRRNVVKVHENGIEYKDRVARWTEIEGVDDTGVINMLDGKPIVLPATVQDGLALQDLVRQRAGAVKLRV
jgi:hypothetical protein